MIIDPDLSIGRRPIGPDRAGDKQTKGKDKNAFKAKVIMSEFGVTNHN